MTPCLCRSCTAPGHAELHPEPLCQNPGRNIAGRGRIVLEEKLDRLVRVLGLGEGPARLESEYHETKEDDNG